MTGLTRPGDLRASCRVSAKRVVVQARAAPVKAWRKVQSHTLTDASLHKGLSIYDLEIET